MIEVSEHEQAGAAEMASRCAEALARVVPRFGRVVKSQLRNGRLTPQQMHMLMEIQDLAERYPEGVQPSELSRRCSLSSPGVTAALDDLVEGGFCSREHSEKDRRKVLVRLTPSGIETLASVRIGVGQALSQMLQGWDQAQIERLLAVLTDLDAMMDTYFQQQHSS